MRFASLFTLFAVLVPLAYAHAFITEIKGSNGKTGVGFGAGGLNMKAGHNAFYRAPRWLKSMSASKTCGVNRRLSPKDTRSYVIDWKSELTAAIKKGLPTADKQGRVKLTVFQLNKDGAGAFDCEVSSNASGNSWKPMKVIGANVPGNARSESDLVNRDHALQIQLPKGVKCTGKGGACLVRCTNQNVNPFGGCFAIAGSGPSKRDLSSRDDHEEDDELLD